MLIATLESAADTALRDDFLNAIDEIVAPVKQT
jgi:hypothetical protein